MKKIIALFLVVTTVGAFMAGCAPKEESAAPEAPAAQEAPKAEAE